MITNNFFILSAILISTGPLFAQQNMTKEDFAFGNEIEITDNKSVIDVVLPEDVYQVAKSNSLTDLAIFNAKGEVVPHILVMPDSKLIDKSLPPENLTVFPVYGEKSSGSHFRHITISTAKDGTITEILNSQQPASNTNNINQAEKNVIGYLIDASKIKNNIEKFQVSLDGIQDNHFIKVILEGSSDLKNWNVIESDVVLGKFEVDAEKLKKDEIQLLGSAYTYYRISWPSSPNEVKLGHIQAVFTVETEKVEAPLQWKAISGTKANNNDQIIYQYDVGGYYPVSGLKIKFADPNSIAKVSVETANDQNGPWSFVQTSTFFSVIQTGAELSNLQTNFSNRPVRFWRLQLNSNKAGVGSRFPDVEFGWRANSVRFLARGDGPFTLAYGSSKVVNAPQADLISADWTKEVGQGNLKNKITFGGDDKLIDEKKSEYPLRKILLWSVLLIGVGLLVSMAMQVKNQIPPAN